MEIDDLKELIEAFLAETDEVLLALESNLITLEQRVDKEVVHLGAMKPLLRPLHTFKGNAGMLGMQTIAALVHGLEEIIKRDIALNQELLKALFSLIDDLKKGLGQIRAGAEDANNLDDWIAYLAALAETTQTDSSQQKIKKTKTSQKASSKMPAFGFADDLITAETNKNQPEVPAAAGAVIEEVGTSLDTTLRVSTEKLDQLQREVGELILAFNATRDFLSKQAMLQNSKTSARELNDRIDRLANRVRRVQAQTTRIRLLGLSSILRRVPRIVRDAAEKTKKKVQVVIDGETTEADKSVVDQLADVIVHLVRNAVDHGIEPPEGRSRAGKSEVGLVIVRAAGKGDHIQIEIEDDGAGVDLELVRRKAVERGLVTADEARLADRDAVLRWLFASGFSTRDTTTELSGRGVGLDIVDRTVRALGGTVRLESTLGEGSKFILSVPISTAVAELLHVDIANNKISVPLRRIIETQRLDREKLSTPGGMPRYRWRNDLLPYIELDGYLQGESTSKPYIMILEQSAGALCVPAAGFLGKSQAVLHPLGDQILAKGPFSGATVMGDGYVSLILDPDRLYRFITERVGLV